MAVKIKKGGLEISISIALILFVLIFVVFYLQLGGKLGDVNQLLQSVNTKLVIVAVVAVTLIILAMVFAKVDSPGTLLAIGLIGAGIIGVALFLPDITKSIGKIIPNIPVTSPEITEAVRQAIYTQYAAPGEVYLVGNHYLQSLANAAGVDLCNWSILGACLRWKTYVGVVYPEILEITTTMPDPKEVWNSIFWLKKFPLDVVVGGQRYVAYCKCDVREYSWIFGYPVTTPSGNTYDPDLNYTHVPKADGEYVINNPPW